MNNLRRKTNVVRELNYITKPDAQKAQRLNFAKIIWPGCTT